MPSKSLSLTVLFSWDVAEKSGASDPHFGGGPCGISVRVVGAPGESVRVVAVDPAGVAHVTTVTLAEAGRAEVEL